MDEADIKIIAREAAAEGARVAMQAMGMDTENPLEAQKDFHFIREMRKGTSTVKTRILVVATGLLVLYGLTSWFPNLKP